MTCDRAQREFSRSLDEDRAPAGLLSAHLDGCESCRAFREVSVRIAGGYRGEVRRGIRALRRLESPRRRPRPVWIAALLLLGLAGGLASRRSAPPEAPAPLATPAAPAAPARGPVLLVDERDLPLLLSSESPPAPRPDPEAPLSEWMRGLPTRLSEDLPPPRLPDLPRFSLEESS